MTSTGNPAALQDYDAAWPAQASRLLAAVRAGFDGLPGARSARFDHIGSTSVPGLAAKPFIDLQVRILPLPDDAALGVRLALTGFERARGSRPDSPGVYRDVPRGAEIVDDTVWEKSLFWQPAERAILHVRRSDSPWGSYTIWFRDWLRTHPDRRAEYEALKRVLSEGEVGKVDYDDYTRAKSRYFDEVQSTFEEWVART